MPATPDDHAVFQARLESEGPPFAALASQPLLQSALQAGIVLESSCRNGTCRSCICRLASGRVVYRIEWPGLSAEEKADGYILPCVAYPVSDLVITRPV
ncbi:MULTISPECIES: 2Fe-2S iron-sulfur cluster-binding protein [unclassified Polaromonas]|jgi:ferredoxin|uniref:2Fe-2S iron-sulfur cluster-binding protein n=1 Tax=unclassified Polaromonas TaxID=2638319 RepID=UPI000BC92F0B|nr:MULTISPECIES: 2Fe-2S iron-sulfur cluster-binding protein [unclassified Polaromonas]OYY32645.1 MAG: ferredoxin [Polaromonas sp. 35-63-35]OYZ16086.1 MAG: ferredoxin [Polaromonas sp. 16-63-31]OYZ75941.1 MAG: ferredoxin [Polaromonas sp. 24-63-21]OZA52921.1 MAG: ferredoxin [Polaromonas sp. 17-63-33]OZA85380.1 MAG: ferredoxin [Polaromonas sp. 39-63-25]